MHVRVYHPALRMNRRVHLPYERTRIHDVGLGELDGFNIGKMFKRMFTFKPSSFTFKNIMGSIGSVVSNVGTLGIGSIVAPKTFSAHSTAMRQVGMGVSAAAVAAGGIAAGAAYGPGILSAAKSVGSSILTGVKSFGSGISNIFGGGSSSSGSSAVADTAQASSGGGWLDTAGKVLETGAKVMTVAQAVGGSGQQVMPMGMYDSSGAFYAPQPVVTGQYPQIIGVAQQAPTGWYPQVENQALMYAGQAGVGVMPGGAGFNGGYYNASGGPVEDGVIRYPDGSVESSTIIPGVADTHVYIGGGVLALGLLYAFTR